ncbi:MAG: ABC transporter substrate-binding protein [Pseudomonadota bacterium]
MLGYLRLSKVKRLRLILLISLAMRAGATSADEPARVVSMNLCTDQLAMMLAGPEQLHSVSYIALDPRASAMVEEARAFEVNRGLAEEIYLMQPDLVIAGAFSTRATVAMLRRLDIPVVVFDPAYSLGDVRERITQMGEVLNRQEAAKALISEFDQRLELLREEVKEKPRAVLYYANGYTSGDQSLAGQILSAAGFENAADEAGYSSGMKLPLEVLAVTNPDIVITSQPYPGASRSEDILTHPVVQSLRKSQGSASITDHNWVCGTPHVLRAIETLSEARILMIEQEP